MTSKRWWIVGAALLGEVFMFGMRPKTYYVFIDGELRGFQSSHSDVMVIRDEGQTYTVIAYGDTVITGTESTPSAQHIRFHPNPFDGALLIYSDEATELRIYDVTGREVRTLSLKQGENRVTLDVAAGVYFWASKGSAGKFVRVQ